MDFFPSLRNELISMMKSVEFERAVSGNMTDKAFNKHPQPTPR